MMNPFYKEEPTETRMLSCPSCNEIIDIRNGTCRFCGLSIDGATAQRLNAEFQQVTDAVASANTFKQSIWAAIPLTVAAPLYLFVATPGSRILLLLAAAPVGFLAYALSWQRKYGSLETRDEDYPGSVRSMRIALLIWAIALVLQVAFVVYAFSSGKLTR